MVGRLFEKFAAPVRGLHQAAYVLALLTLAAQILALLRDRTFADVFGASHTLDLYYAAFRIPDLVFALVASLVSAYVLIPRISGASKEETLDLLSQSISFLLLVGGGFCLILAIFAPDLLFLLYPAFADSPLRDTFITLTRILLLQPVILGLSGIITSVTQVHRRFALFAFSPVLYNFGIIMGALFLYPRFGLTGIGWGVVIGAVLHAAIHIPVLLRAGVFPRVRWPKWRVMRSVVHDSFPRSLALGMGSLTLLGLTALASRIGAGSVSVFTFALNLEAVPLSLIGASYAVAAFPALSEHSALKNQTEFTKVLSAAARHVILWSLVFVGFIVVLRAHLVRVILGAGAFDWAATRLTAALLAILAIGLVAQGLVLLFSRALYAAKESWRPFFYQLGGGIFTLLAAVALLALNQSGSSLLSFVGDLFRVGDVGGTTILLIALASTLGQIILAIASLVALRSIAPGLASTLARPFRDGVVAAVMGGVVTYSALYLLGGIAPLTTLFAVFTQGFIAGIVGLAASGLVLYLLKNEEFRDFRNALTRMVGAKQALPPSAEEPAQP